jgi:hypothetical protein
MPKPVDRNTPGPGDLNTKHTSETYTAFYNRQGRGLTYDEAELVEKKKKKLAALKGKPEWYRDDMTSAEMQTAFDENIKRELKESEAEIRAKAEEPSSHTQSSMESNELEEGLLDEGRNEHARMGQKIREAGVKMKEKVDLARNYKYAFFFLWIAVPLIAIGTDANTAVVIIGVVLYLFCGLRSKCLFKEAEAMAVRLLLDAQVFERLLDNGHFDEQTPQSVRRGTRREAPALQRVQGQARPDPAYGEPKGKKDTQRQQKKSRRCCCCGCCCTTFLVLLVLIVAFFLCYVFFLEERFGDFLELCVWNPLRLDLQLGHYNCNSGSPGPSPPPHHHNQTNQTVWLP